MQLSGNRLAFKIALIYVLVAGSWILFSDKLVASLGRHPNESMVLSVLKGWGFVLLTGGLLYWMLRNWSRKWGEQATQLRAAAENLRRTERALRTLSACNQVLVRATNETALLSEICRVMVESGGYRLAWVGFAENDEPKSVRIAAHAGHDEGYLAQAKITWGEASERGRGPTGVALRTGRVTACHDFRSDPKGTPWRAEARQRGYAAAIALPLRSGENTFGSLTLYSTTTDDFNVEEVELLTELADDLAYGIQTLRVRVEHQEAEARLRHEQYLYLDLVNTLPAGMYRLRVKPAANAVWTEATWTAQLAALYSVDFVSDRFCEITGIRRDDFLANPTAVPEQIHPEDRPGFDRRNVEAVTAQSVFSWEGRLLGAEGGTSWIHLESTPRQFENGEVIWTGIVYDITARKLAEEKLRSALVEAERFRTAMDEVNACVYMKDLQSRYTYANRPTLELLGRSTAKVVGSGDTHFFRPAINQRQRAIDARVFQGEQTVEEIEIPDAAGGRRVFWEVKTPIYADAARRTVSGLLGISTDITKRKLMEEMLQHSQSLLAESEAMGKVGGWEIEIATQRLIWTKTVFHIHELDSTRPPTVTEGLHFYTPACRPIIERAVQRAIELGETFDEELEIITAKGNPRHVHTIGHADLVRGKVFGFFQDITERKQAEQALTTMALRHQTLLRMGSDGIHVLDEQGNIIEANEAFANLLGYTRDEALQLNVTDWDAQWSQAELLAKIAELIIRPAMFETRHRRKDGSFIEVEIHAVGVVLEGRHYLYAAARDITARKQAENTLRQNEARFHSLTKILQYHSEKLQDFLDFALEQALKLTGSRLGFIYFYHENRQQFVLSSWSKNVMKECAILNPQTCSALDQAGLWGEAVRQRRPIVLNDFQAAHPLKKGYPEGHAPLHRFLTLPIFSGDQIVAVVAVANKPAAYDQSDIEQLKLMMEAVWKVVEQRQAEAALRESEARYRQLFDLESDAVVLVDCETHRYVDVNLSAQRLYGYAREEFLQLTPADVSTEPEKTRAVIGSGSFNIPLRWHRKKNGALFAAEITGNQIIYQGRPTDLTTIRDITTRQQVMDKLHDTTRQLLEAQRIANLGSYVFDVQRGTWTSSEVLDEVFGFTEPGVILELAVWLQIIHPEEREEMQRYLTEEVLTGQTPFDRTYRIIRANDQSERWVHGLGQVTFDDHGQAVQMVGIIQDITARKQVEDAHARLATAVEQAAETIVISDLKGTILYVNPAFERTTGYTCAEVLGQNARVLKSGKQDADFYRRMWDVLDCGQIWQGRFTNRRKDGTNFEEEATISPIRNTQGKIVNFVAVKRDVTREVQLESQFRQAQKMEAIGTLAGGIAHDFNNILAAVFGYAYLLQQDTEGNAPAQESVTEILTAANRAKELVQQILTFSRQREQKREVIRLDIVVREATKFLRASLPAHVKIEIKLAEDAPAVLADATQIYQVTLNLATNALHALTDQPGQITVSLNSFWPTEPFLQAHPEFRSIQYARLLVADTGHGMDARTLERIFEPFFTTKQVGKGTGLGLAMVHGIVQAHDGIITVASEVGLGTIFSLYFPAQTDPGQAISPVTATERMALGKGQKVLLVDDEPALTATFQRLLERLQYHVTICNHAPEAIALFQEDAARFDLVVTDLTMPEMNGLEVARQIRQLRPGLPVMLVSGFAPDLTPERLQEAGICELLTKPVSLARLAEALQRALTKA